MKVWEGLAILDSVSNAVKGGHFIHPVYTTIRPMKLHRKAATPRVEPKLSTSLDDPVTEFVSELNNQMVTKGHPSKVDWEALAKLVDGVKL